jgi:hypothetical protein
MRHDPSQPANTWTTRFAALLELHCGGSAETLVVGV